MRKIRCVIKPCLLVSLLAIGCASLQSHDNESKFSRIDIVLIVQNLYYADNEKERDEEIKEVEYWLKKHVENFLLPKLINQGFKVKYLSVHNIPKLEGQGILTIDYDETKGGGYGFDPYGSPPFYGVNIKCTLKLIHPVTGKAIWKDRAKASNSLLVSNGLHIDALQNLESEFKQININLDKWVRK